MMGMIILCEVTSEQPCPMWVLMSFCEIYTPYLQLTPFPLVTIYGACLNVMEFDPSQKMHSPHPLPQSQPISICSQLNLNPDKLRIESLLASPTYRRLYNIVRNDMSRSDLSFRKNLIKELYFLLQITPIIKPELKEHFLGEVERWYNLNDHKKIDLASSKLNDLLSIVHHSRKDTQRDGPQRPKTGTAWNTNVSPFLRPYTASRQRPQSGLGTKTNNLSTEGDTNDICIREFTTNIQEELQMSEDFLQRHRTNHPDYEPTYEQLYQILKKVERHSQQGEKEGKENGKKPTPIVSKCQRYSKSALPKRTQLQTAVIRDTPQSDPHIAQPQQPLPPAQQMENEERDRDSDSSSSSQEEQMLYVSEKRQEQPNGLRLQVPSPTAEGGQPDGLQKYLHCMEQKLVQALRQDREMAKNYVGFARAKTAFKRELNRKTESRRLLSAKQGAREYRLKRPASAGKGGNESEILKGKVIDLREDPLNFQADSFEKHPTYNRRQFLKKRYEEPVARFKKLNNCEQQKEKVKEKVKRPMTACLRFHSPVRFDPLSPHNVANYNTEVLQEIQKIKMRLGGKCSASTDSLMKALYVDTSPTEARWEELSPYFGMVSNGKKEKLKKKGRRNKSKPKVTGNK